MGEHVPASALHARGPAGHGGARPHVRSSNPRGMRSNHRGSWGRWARWVAGGGVTVGRWGRVGSGSLGQGGGGSRGPGWRWVAGGRVTVGRWGRGDGGSLGRGGGGSRGPGWRWVAGGRGGGGSLGAGWQWVAGARCVATGNLWARTAACRRHRPVARRHVGGRI